MAQVTHRKADKRKQQTETEQKENKMRDLGINIPIIALNINGLNALIK